MIYNIEIFETNCMVETIEADTKEEAIMKVLAAYNKGDIKLTDENAYVDVSFNCV